MDVKPERQSWFGPSPPEPNFESTDKPQEYERLWRGFMTARAMLGLVLLSLQGTIYTLGPVQDTILILVCAGYFVIALGARLMARPARPGRTSNFHWIATTAVDILVFAGLQAMQGHSINYTPLFALPILMASVLGPLLVALAAAAAVSLLLLAFAAWSSIQGPSDMAALFLQAALTGTGFFAISFLANQIATRLAKVELRARRSQLAERVQRQVNELVIESMTDGILVVDPQCMVRAANPAARQMLGAECALGSETFDLACLIGWQGLVDLMQLAFLGKSAKPSDVTIRHLGQGPRRLRVHTQLATTNGGVDERLCVMFLQDQREVEARMRSEKLASMGRMSAAVAHEIRNPLAAIAQANALLDEDLDDPRHKQLTQMVRQNTRRLERIVEEVLDISHVQRRERALAAPELLLNETISRICLDWQTQTSSEHLLRVDVSTEIVTVRFESEHLRRILVNLLDNARRYASSRPSAIQVHVGASTQAQVTVGVWSDGPPMDHSVERHMFEPFFSSESRSSGLGLYICRELCEEQGASIVHFRTARILTNQPTDGNVFLLTFPLPQSHVGAKSDPVARVP